MSIEGQNQNQKASTRRNVVDPCECYKKKYNHNRFNYGSEVAEYGEREEIKEGM